MRILLLSTWFPYPADNGSKLRALYLLTGLARYHDVTAIAFDRECADPAEAANEIEVRGARVMRVAQDPFRLVGAPAFARYLSPIPLSHVRAKAMVRAVNQVASGQHWDAVVALQMPTAGYVAQLPGVPAVLDLDTSLSYLLRAAYEGQRGALRRGRAWVSWQKAYAHTKRSLRRFSACVVASPLELRHLQTMIGSGECCAGVIPNGADCRLNSIRARCSETRTLIFTGPLAYRANFDAMQYFLTSIYPLVRAEIPDVSMTITGSLENVASSKLPLDPSIRLLGYVQDIRPNVQEAAVCVVPLRQGGGTRLKILEAMALGVPVVSTKKGAEGLEVQDKQHLLLADTEEEFAAKVIMLLRNREQCERLVANARSLVEKIYDWEQIGSAFARFVEAAVDSRAAETRR